MFNEVILIGEIAKKPIIRETQQGIKIATMILQIQRPYRNNYGVKEIDYVNCILWKGIASQIIDTCDLGSIVGIKGRLQSKSYEDNENKILTTMEVKVEHVEIFDKYIMKK